MFVQVIQGQVSDAGQARAALDRWAQELASNDEEWKRQHALRGYAAEGVQMSIKQMSAQLLSVDIGDQENYIDLQRMRARQVWDECKHSKLHADVLIGKGWVANERELMDIAQANSCEVDVARAHGSRFSRVGRCKSRELLLLDLALKTNDVGVEVADRVGAQRRTAAHTDLLCHHPSLLASPYCVARSAIAHHSSVTASSPRSSMRQEMISGCAVP